jgi:hypothetical protein
MAKNLVSMKIKVKNQIAVVKQSLKQIPAIQKLMKKILKVEIRKKQKK